MVQSFQMKPALLLKLSAELGKNNDFATSFRLSHCPCCVFLLLGARSLLTFIFPANYTADKQVRPGALQWPAISVICSHFFPTFRNCSFLGLEMYSLVKFFDSTISSVFTEEVTPPHHARGILSCLGCNRPSLLFKWVYL